MSLKLVSQWPGMVVHPCNPCNWETEAGRTLQVEGQPELQRETPYLKPKTKASFS